MPQIIVAADRGAAFGEGAVTFRERVNVSDFTSEHFAAQLVERLGWAVEDADVAERDREQPAESPAMDAPHDDEANAPEEHESVEAESPQEDRVAIHAPA